MGRYLNYLELDGDCYFYTKIVPNYDTQIHLDVMFTAEGYDNRDAVFVGCTTPNEQDTDVYIANYGSDNYITAKYGDGDILDEAGMYSHYAPDDRWTLVLTPGVYKQSYDEWSSDVVQFAFSNFGNAGADITIGGLNGDNGLERGAMCRIYGVQIYQDGNLVGDFKPYEDDFDGLGFINDVSGFFMANQGRGTPVGPQDIEVFPTMYNMLATGGVLTASVTNSNNWGYLDVYGNIQSIYQDFLNNTLDITIGENYDTANTKHYQVEITDFDTQQQVYVDIYQDAAQPVIETNKMILGGYEVSKMYIGTSEVDAAYLDNVLVYEGGTQPTPSPTYMGYIYEDGSYGYTQSHFIDTNVPHTSTAMTIEIEYYGYGYGNSDRMVGYQDMDLGCSSDDNDFRIFGYQGGAFDYMNNRQMVYSLTSDQLHDITIGNSFCYDNINETYMAQFPQENRVPSYGCHIYVDVSWNKPKRVLIKDGDNVLFDGRAAELNGVYGLFDSVTNTMFTNTNFTISGEPEPEEIIFNPSVPEW